MNYTKLDKNHIKYLQTIVEPERISTGLSNLEWMKQIKALFDPNNILNPGKYFREVFNRVIAHFYENTHM